MLRSCFLLAESKAWTGGRVPERAAPRAAAAARGLVEEVVKVVVNVVWHDVVASTMHPGVSSYPRINAIHHEDKQPHSLALLASEYPSLGPPNIRQAGLDSSGLARVSCIVLVTQIASPCPQQREVARLVRGNASTVQQRRGRRD